MWTTISCFWFLQLSLSFSYFLIIASSQTEDEGGGGRSGDRSKYISDVHPSQLPFTASTVQSTEELLKGQLRHGFSVETEPHRLLRRAATARLERLWDFGVIPYDIESNFSGTLAVHSH